ncbi:glycine receptor subunit alpha-2-like isoform X2 [Macrobrachium nipponense]|uniref:glycine receptor subunit alpha-2-like isoform X2 n=1 Tax=Macrobrachium nipponense TaxID=159736 RepID=UPI0030C8A08B
MTRALITLGLGLLLLCHCGLAEKEKHRTKQQQFLSKLLEHYDVNDWPNVNKSDATEVYVQMFLNSFGSLNAANMDYSIDVFLRQSWLDHRLNFAKANGANRSRITINDPGVQARIWKPDTFFNNVKDAEIHRVTMNNVLLRLNATGHVLYSMRMTLKLSCNLQLEHFPFDQQVCGVILASYANTDDVIKYHWVDDTPIDLPDELEIAQFDLLNFETSETTQHFVTGDFSGLVVQFFLRRQNGYHVLQTYIPTILIVAISWVSFWLDPNAVPGRVSLGVTTLLTLTTLASGIRQSLPPVSYVKAIDVWVGMCMIMVFGALLEFTFVNWLANKKILNPGNTFRVPRIFAGSDAEQLACAEDPAAKPPTTYMMYARALDRLCRVLFPGGFLLFNLIYWPYYLIQQYSDE